MPYNQFRGQGDLDDDSYLNDPDLYGNADQPGLYGNPDGGPDVVVPPPSPGLIGGTLGSATSSALAAATASGGGGRQYDAQDPTTWSTEQLLGQLYREGLLSKGEALTAIQQWEENGLEGLRQSLSEADRMEGDAINQLDAFFQSQEQDPLDYGEYVGDLDSQAATARADRASRNAQYDALDKLRGWTSTELTPEEKFIMAQTRAAEERDQRAAREASLRDLEARGVRSGAAEMASVLGAQGITSQNRMLQDLGALSSAQQRALGATEAYGRQADVLSDQTFNEGFQRGSAADAISKFNNQLRTDYQRDKARFDLDQQDSRFNRRDKLAGRTIDFAGNKAGRAGDLADRQFGTTALTVGTHMGKSPANDALDKIIGYREAEKARNDLKKDDSFKIYDPSTWGIPGL